MSPRRTSSPLFFKAQQYFENIAASKAPARVRKAATEMADEERAHVRLIPDWMKRVPQVTE